MSTLEALIKAKEMELAKAEAESKKVRDFTIQITNWMSYAISRVNRALTLGVDPSTIADSLDESIMTKWVKDPTDEYPIKKAFVNATAEFLSGDATEADLIVIAVRNRYAV